MLMVATSITASFTPSLFPCLTHWCAGSGCSEFAQDYPGSVLFVKRGSCDFQTKVCIHPCLHPPHACSATCTPLHTTAHLLHTIAHNCTPLHTIAHHCTQVHTVAQASNGEAAGAAVVVVIGNSSALYIMDGTPLRTSRPFPLLSSLPSIHLSSLALPHTW